MSLGQPHTVSIGGGYSLRLEDFGSKIMHIKGINSTVANVISRLDFGPVQDEKAIWMSFMKCLCHHTMHALPEDSSTTKQNQLNIVC